MAVLSRVEGRSRIRQKGAAHSGGLRSPSVIASGLMIANTAVLYGWSANSQAIGELHLNSPLGFAVQALQDALFMIVLCWTADAALGADDMASLLVGYDVDLDGYAVVMDEEGVILASDDPGWLAPGSSFMDVTGLGENTLENAPSGVAELDWIIGQGGQAVVRVNDRAGEDNFDFTFLSAGSFDGGYIVMMYPSSLAHESRFETMLSATLLALLLNNKTGELTYVNAGHNPPLMHRDGTWSWLRDVSGKPLGLFDGIPYKGADVRETLVETGRGAGRSAPRGDSPWRPPHVYRSAKTRPLAMRLLARTRLKA